MLRMRKLVTLLLVVVAISAYGQVPEASILWQKGYGGGGLDAVSKHITKTSDGGFIISIGSNSTIGSGNLDSFCSLGGDRTIYLKYNSNATMLEWVKCYTGGDIIFPIDNGDFIFVGITRTVPSGWAFEVNRKNSSGLILWQRSYGGQAASAILRDMIAIQDGGYLMFGETNYSDTDFTIHHGSWTNADFALIKVDSNGNKMWSKVIGGSGDERAISIVSAPDDGCYIMGTTFSTDYDCTGNHGGDDIYLARIDKNGNLVWQQLIGGSGGDNGNCAVSDGKGGVIVAGASNSTDGDRTHFPSFGCPIWVLDVDSNSNILWNNCFGGGGGNCYANSICKATDGSIWMAGVSTNAGAEVAMRYGVDDAWFVHADSVGNFINAKVLGSRLWDRATMVYPLSNANVIGGGFYDDSGGSFIDPFEYYGGLEDAFLVVFTPSTTSIEVLPKAYTLNLYPNPSNILVTIELPENETGNVHIYNSMGQVMYSGRVLGHKTLAVSIADWAEGVYFVKWNGDNGAVVGGRFVKM